MTSIYPGDRDPDPSAVPGVDPQHGGESGAVAVTLDVDGELFSLCPDTFGGTNYTWLTGPNPGYGFGTSPTPSWSTEQHKDNVREFLADIDPATGYLSDE